MSFAVLRLHAAKTVHWCAVAIRYLMKAKSATTEIQKTATTVPPTAKLLPDHAVTAKNKATKHATKPILNMAKAKESVLPALTTVRL